MQLNVPKLLLRFLPSCDQGCKAVVLTLELGALRGGQSLPVASPTRFGSLLSASDLFGNWCFVIGASA